MSGSDYTHECFTYGVDLVEGHFAVLVSPHFDVFVAAYGGVHDYALGHQSVGDSRGNSSSGGADAPRDEHGVVRQRIASLVSESAITKTVG